MYLDIIGLGFIWYPASYLWFLRYSELEALKESDLQVFSDHMETFIESSQNDKYR